MIAETRSESGVEGEAELKHPDSASDDTAHEDSTPKKKSEFAMSIVNSVKAINSGELSYHEIVNSFIIADELKCLYLFIKALPYNPIDRIYPETPFLIFKGVTKPKMFDLTEETARNIENYMKDQNAEYYSELRLHDLDQYYLDSYETAVRIYNDMAEKTRNSYHADVKQAKTQVVEISAVFVCLFIIAIVLFGIAQ